MTEKRGRMARPAPVADLMAGIFAGKPAGKRLEEGKIWLVWDAAVGRQIAAKARPSSIRDGVLTVCVVSAPWMQQLTYLRQQIVAKVNELLGADLVRDIYLKSGRQEAPHSSPKTVKSPPRTLSPLEIERISAQTSTISDQELRDSFAKLLTRHLSQSGNKPG